MTFELFSVKYFCMANSSAVPLPFGELLKRSITFVRTYIGPILSLTILILIPDLLTQLVVKLMVVPADTPGAIMEGGTVIDGRAYGFSPLLSELLVAFSVIELLAAFTFFVVYANIWVLSLAKEKALPIFTKPLSKLLPLFGVHLWAHFRSFGWLLILSYMFAKLGLRFKDMNNELLSGALAIMTIGCALAGIICSIVFSPRFIAAPLLYLREKKGIRESVESSLRRTKGYWGKIVGNSLLLLLCVLPVSFVIIILSRMQRGIIGLDGEQLVMILVLITLIAICRTLIIGVMTGFMKELAETVVQHPRPER